MLITQMYNLPNSYLGFSLQRTELVACYSHSEVMSVVETILACAECSKLNSTLLCDKCKSVSYCSTECQTRHRSKHESFCNPETHCTLQSENVLQTYMEKYPAYHQLYSLTCQWMMAHKMNRSRVLVMYMDDPDKRMVCEPRLLGISDKSIKAIQDNTTQCRDDQVGLVIVKTDNTYYYVRSTLVSQ